MKTKVNTSGSKFCKAFLIHCALAKSCTNICYIHISFSNPQESLF